MSNLWDVLQSDQAIQCVDGHAMALRKFSDGDFFTVLYNAPNNTCGHLAAEHFRRHNA